MAVVITLTRQHLEALDAIEIYLRALGLSQEVIVELICDIMTRIPVTERS